MAYHEANRLLFKCVIAFLGYYGTRIFGLKRIKQMIKHAIAGQKKCAQTGIGRKFGDVAAVLGALRLG